MSWVIQTASNLVDVTAEGAIAVVGRNVMERPSGRRVLLGVGREVAIVASATLLVFIATRWFKDRPAFEPSTRNTQAVALPQPGIGMQLEVRGAQTKNVPMTLLLVVSPSCRYCIQSQSFYRTLASAAESRRAHLIVSVPHAQSAQSFLRDAGLNSATLREWPDVNLRIVGTPALFAVNSAGKIKRIWHGALSEQRRRDVLSVLDEPAALDAPVTAMATGEANLTEEDLRDVLDRNPQRIVLDVRERDEFARGHLPEAINIPLIELPTRIAYELDPSRFTIVDCSSLFRPEACQSAVDRLVEHGFRRVAALNGNQANADVCWLTPAI